MDAHKDNPYNPYRQCSGVVAHGDHDVVEQLLQLKVLGVCHQLEVLHQGIVALHCDRKQMS